MADSLALTYDVEKIGIEATQTEGQYKVNFGDATMLVTMSEDGKITVGETHGLFAYSPERLSFAKSTGQFIDSLDDKTNAERMADEEFSKYLNQKIKDQQNNALKVVSVKKGDYVEGLGGQNLVTLVQHP